MISIENEFQLRQLTKFECYSKEFDLEAYPPMVALRAKIGRWTGEITSEDGWVEEVSARGIEIGGIPVGEKNYELGMCSEIAGKIESEITNFEDQLHPTSTHAAFSMGYYCLLPKFDHWLRHLPPNITGPASRRIDAAMSRYLNGILGSPTELPELVKKRIQLSGRHFGLGYRSREELVAPVAYVAGFIEAHERFLEGERGTGFFQQLEGLLTWKKCI